MGEGGTRRSEKTKTQLVCLFLSIFQLTLAAVWKLLTVLPSSFPSEGSLDGPVGIFSKKSGGEDRRSSEREKRSSFFFFFFFWCVAGFFYLFFRQKNLTENQRRDAGDNSQFRQSQAKEATADDILWWCLYSGTSVNVERLLLEFRKEF